jgi:hypothetical protein
MTITITIDPTVESVGIQTIAKALNVTGTDADCRLHLANHLRTITANLYVRGDQLKRDETANATAVAAAASKITIT